ncbi:hypothetical protein ABZX85_23145 [Streptomyces sp. NPDC004539]|uniref:hypothetical protein n=1 Tax=Streptomyces sp. NPDC004539 TaxID=3154280 RepID=UPI0033A2BA8C
MIPQITVGAAFLMAALIGATWLARWWVSPEPAGRHRAGAVAPVEALVQVDAHCRSCRHTTRHAILRVHGEHICRSCGCLNTAVVEGVAR